jgi:transcription antitermination factor NusG
MQDDQIEAIRQILEGGFVPENDDYFEVGEEVEISYGPLQGIRGIISTKRNESRFILKVDGINQAISVMIDSNWLMKAKT